MSNAKLFFSILFLLNIFIKFYGIGDNSLWIDEAYSVKEATLNIGTIIQHSSQSDNPPLYYILLHYWTNIFGISEGAVRSFSAVCSVIAALLIFLFVSRNTNALTGLLAGIFFTVSNENLFYAQEARTYAWIVLLATLSIGLFLELLRDRRRVFLVYLTVINILLVYSHYISGLIPIVEFLLAFIFMKSNKRLFYDMLVSNLFLFICFLPWLNVPLNHHPVEGRFWLEHPNFSNFKGVMIGIAGNKATLIYCFLMVALTIYQKSLTRNFLKNFTPLEISLVALCFIPIISIYIIAFYTPIFLMRYLLFASIPFYMLIPILMNKIFTNRKYYLSAGFILILLPVYSLQLHPGKDENWRDAIAQFRKIRNENAPAILSASYISNVFSYYYDKKIFLMETGVDEALIKENIFPLKPESASDLSKLVSNEHLYCLYCHEQIEDPDGKIEKQILINYNVERNFYFDKVRLVEYTNLFK